jgi:hypothetical protein
VRASGGRRSSAPWWRRTKAPARGRRARPEDASGRSPCHPTAPGRRVWVRVRGEPLRAIRAADQRLAERENFAASDFPPDFEHESLDSNSCEARNEAGLTIRGESRSVFVRLVEEPASAVAALGLTRVYATPKQAAAAFGHEAVLATARCEFGDLPPRTKIRPLRLGGLPARARAFRIEFSDEDVSGHSDVVFLQRGRSVARLRFAMFNAPSTLERGAIARVASRMR